jgi:hypothetical protein
MRISRIRHLAKIVRSKGQRSFGFLRKFGGAHVKTGLFAAALFALAYAVETKAVLSLESSQNLFEIMR